MTVAKMRVYLAHRSLKSVAARVFEKAQGVKFPVALNNSWSDFYVSVEDDLVFVSLATKRVRVQTLALAARLLGQAVVEGTGPRELAVGELRFWCVCLKGFFLSVKLESGRLCSEEADLTQRACPRAPCGD